MKGIAGGDYFTKYRYGLNRKRRTCVFLFSYFFLSPCCRVSSPIAGRSPGLSLSVGCSVWDVFLSVGLSAGVSCFFTDSWLSVCAVSYLCLTVGVLIWRQSAPSVCLPVSRYLRLPVSHSPSSIGPVFFFFSPVVRHGQRPEVRAEL